MISITTPTLAFRSQCLGIAKSKNAWRKKILRMLTNEGVGDQGK